jgi:hypothetical protein
MAKTDLEMEVTEDFDLHARAGGAVDASEALARRAPPNRAPRKGDFDAMPKNMVPSGSDKPLLTPVSPAAFGNRLAAAANTIGQPKLGPVPVDRRGGYTFSFIVENRTQGRESVPCVVVEGKRAFMRALPLAELGVRMETGRKYIVTVTETQDSTPTLRRLGPGNIQK